MPKTFIPQGYHSKLGLYDTQNAIEVIKSTFLESLSTMLRLKRVLRAAVSSTPPRGSTTTSTAWSGRSRLTYLPQVGSGEVVQSLAKWKR